jgi:formamidopyrimidine-DNA glycosylase
VATVTNVPELPEVESARAVIERSALGRRIAAVDDTDTWVCRPHPPGQIADALVGRTLTAIHRRGKSMWAETSGLGRSRTPGPVLGIHLGMSGRIYVERPDHTVDEGGDYLGSQGRTPTSAPVWDRFTLTFADGGSLRLFDKRRLGRVRLDPDIEALGPDAATVSLAEFRQLLGRSAAPVKARILDQHALAGVGNLLADEALWQAAVDPRQPADELADDQVRRLHRAVLTAVRRGLKRGGVHYLDVVPHRGRGQHCPRCGAPMQRATVGTRTTWFCSREQSA